MKKGDEVVLTVGSKSVTARVEMISPSTRALWLSFDDVLDGHVGGMPVMRMPDGQYVSALSGLRCWVDVKH
jgi:hypothetical protein